MRPRPVLDPIDQLTRLFRRLTQSATMAGFLNLQSPAFSQRPVGGGRYWPCGDTFPFSERGQPR